MSFAGFTIAVNFGSNKNNRKKIEEPAVVFMETFKQPLLLGAGSKHHFSFSKLLYLWQKKMNKDEIIYTQIEPLLNYFQSVLPLNKEEQRLVAELFKPRLYRKRQYVLQEGDICNQCNFVVRGCLRMYKVDANGNTHIIQFASENWWIMDLGSFHGRTPSELNIDALEDTMVLQINYDNLLSLYIAEPKFDRIFRVLIENSFVSLQKRLLQNISTNAEEKYLAFLQSYSHLANRLPQTQIASFLGISPEFLSRLRNKQVKRQS